MKNIDRNEDFNNELIDFYEDEDLVEIIQVEYYPWADNDIKYVVIIQLDEEPAGTVEFVHQQVKISDKTLSRFEARSVFKSLSELTLPLTLWNDLETTSLVDILPDIKSAIVINTNIKKTKFEWYSSDSMNYPNQLEKLDKLVEIINDLIDPDTSNLSMPIYL
jgi:hypothetical protein